MLEDLDDPINFSKVRSYHDTLLILRAMHFNPAELHMAIIYKNLEAVKQIVASICLTGGDLDRLWRGSSPVSCALYIKAYPILEYLVKHGASVNIRTRDYKMEPPLFAACRLSQPEAVHILLQSATVDIDQRDFFNRTPLWAASRYSNIDMVELILNRGANIRAAQDFIECPLIQSTMMLQRERKSKIPHLLVKRGCNLDFKNHEGSPLYFCVKFRVRDLFCLMVRAGCKTPNEEWLTREVLPISWRKDEEFCNWVCSLHNNPRPLLQLASHVVRNRLVDRYKSIFFRHVDELPIPSTLKNILYLED